MSKAQPGLFLGGQKLITSDITSAQVVEMLTGQSSGIVSEYGYAALNENKKVDSKYLPVSQQICVYEDNILKSDNITKLNFTGEYVQVQTDQTDSTVNIHIGKVQNGTYFNTIDGQYNSKLKNDFDLVDMIVPDVSMGDGYITKMYGDWEPGEIHKGINYYPEYKTDCFAFTPDVTFWTEDPVFTPNDTSYFQINVYDARTSLTEPSYIMSTEKISETSESILLSQGDNKNISIEILEFTKHSSGYTFKPVFKFDLEGMLLRRLNDSACHCNHQSGEHCEHHTEQNHICTCHVFGGRFRIEIIHVINTLVQYKYTSEDLIFNTGFLPSVSEVDVKLSDTKKAVYKYCSGIKYLTRGALEYSCEVDNLNFWTATEKKIELHSDLFDKEFVYTDNDFVKDDLSFNSQNNTFKYISDVKQNIVNAGEVLTVSGIAYNAYGKDTFAIEKYYLIDTKDSYSCDCNCECECNCGDSTDTKELFIDESKRLTSTGNTWNSSDRLTFFKETSLMVIPHKGLCYPYGKYDYGTLVIPEQRIDYTNFSGIGYYYRNFVNTNNSINEYKYGGVFNIEGITKEQFNNSEFVLEISIDNGKTWFNCKADRQVYEVQFENNDVISQISNGIFSDLQETENGINVKFVFNRNVINTDVFTPCIQGNTPILLKLGFSNLLNDLIINKIELLNLDGKTNW